MSGSASPLLIGEAPRVFGHNQRGCAKLDDLDEIRWYAPTYVGDEATFAMEIAAIRAFASKPSQVNMTMCVVATRQDGS